MVAAERSAARPSNRAALRRKGLRLMIFFRQRRAAAVLPCAASMLRRGLDRPSAFLAGRHLVRQLHVVPASFRPALIVRRRDDPDDLRRSLARIGATMGVRA